MVAKNYKLASSKKAKLANKSKLLVPVSNAKVMIKGSVSKINRDLNVIRGLNLEEAMNYLFFSNYSSSQPLAKLLKSAAANALNKGLVQDLKELVISQVWANKSLQLKRMRAGSRGKPSPRTKVYSNVFVELAIPQGE